MYLQLNAALCSLSSKTACFFTHMYLSAACEFVAVMSCVHYTYNMCTAFELAILIKAKNWNDGQCRNDGDKLKLPFTLISNVE